MPRVVCFRKFQLRDELTEANAINELLFDVTFAVSLAPLQLIWPDSADTGIWADFLLLFVSRYMLSYHMAVYSNRFCNEEFIDNVFKAGMMMGFVLIASSSVLCQGDSCGSVITLGPQLPGVLTNFATLCLSTAFCHLVVAVMFARGVCHPVAAGFCRLYSISNVGLAVLWGCGAMAASRQARVAVLAAAAAVLLAVEVAARLPWTSLSSRLPAHLATRMRKFQVVSITQVFAGLAQPRLDYSVPLFMFAGGALAQTLGMKVLFFDFEGIHRSDKGFVQPQWLSETAWVALHLVLSGTMTVFGSACSLAVRSGIRSSDTGQRAAVAMFCGATALLVVCLTCLSIVLRGAGSGVRRWRKRWRVTIRLAVAALMATMPWWGEAIPLPVLPWAVFALTAALVGAELYGRAHRSHYAVGGSTMDLASMQGIDALASESSAAHGAGGYGTAGGTSDDIVSTGRSPERRARASSVTSEASVYLFE